MMKILILFCLFLSFLFADDIAKEEKFLRDISHSLTIEDILTQKNTFEPIKKYNLGIIKEKVWVHLHLENTTNKPLIKRVSTRFAGLDFVDVFVVENNHLVKTYKLGDFREHQLRDNHFRTSYFDIHFKRNQKIDVYIKEQSYTTMDMLWRIENIDDFNDYYSSQGMIYSFISGMLILATIISLILFFLLKNKFYFIYSLFTIGSITYQSTITGIFYQLNIPLYLNTFFGFCVPLITMIFLGLFPFYFFNLKKNEFIVIKMILKILMALLGVFVIIESFYPFYPDVLYFSKYTNLISFLSIFTLFIFSVLLFIHKKQGSLFYLLSNLILLFFITLFLLVLSGLIKYYDFHYYTLASGAIAQDVFLGLALIHTTYLIRKNDDKNKELLNEYSKLSFIGQTMVNISHQWKTPINSIYNSINHIEVAKEFKDKDIDKIIDKNLNRIKETTLYLRETGLNQLNFYKEKNNMEEMFICDEINNVIKLIECEFSKKFINIEFACDEEIVIQMEKNYFLNILMILFENAFKIFEKRDIPKPHILLKIVKKKEKIEIVFEDNAGGVSGETINKIFEKDFSQSASTGIGLYLAKEIVSQKLNGEISAENKKDGLAFRIVI